MLQTDSTHTGEVWNKIEAIELDKQGVKWVMSKPLFYRPEPTKFVIEKIAQTAGKTPLNKVGVVLASHGEPDEWTGFCLKHQMQGTGNSFLCLCEEKGRLRKVLSGTTLSRDLMSLPHPELPEAVEKLADKNLEKVIVMTSFGSTDCMHVNYNIQPNQNLPGSILNLEIVLFRGMEL